MFQKKTASIFHADDAPEEMASKQFRCYTTFAWRRNFLLSVCVPHCGLWIWAASQMDNHYLVLPQNAGGTQPFFRVNEVAILILATYMDAQNIYLAARYVVCIFNRWLPSIEIDASLSNSLLRVGPEDIKFQKNSAPGKDITRTAHALCL